jgi:hypothetical protein
MVQREAQVGGGSQVTFLRIPASSLFCRGCSSSQTKYQFRIVVNKECLFYFAFRWSAAIPAESEGRRGFRGNHWAAAMDGVAGVN